MKYSLIYLFSIINVLAFGQWNQLTNVYSGKLNTIQVEPGFVMAAGGNRVLKSTDNGGSWTPIIANYVGTSIIGNIEAIHFFNVNNGLMAGPLFTSNDELIFKTINGGSDWTIVHQNGIGNWPREINDLQMLSTSLGFATGTNGKVYKTTNGGDTWTLISQIGLESMEDLWFVNTMTGFLAGDNGVWKTQDGGITWSQVSSNPGEYLTAIHFSTPTDGIAVGEYNLVLQTNDGGDTWQDISVRLGDGDYFTDIAYTSSSTAYITGLLGVYKTTSGGQYWEFQSLPTEIYGIDMTSDNEGYVCGEYGSIYKTTNGGGDYAPIATFGISGNNCQDSILQFTNYSVPAATHEWFVDGNLESTSYNYATSFSTGGPNHLIELVVSNGVTTDTSTQSVNITTPPILIDETNITVAQDSLCAGAGTTVKMNFSYYGAEFWLEDSLGTVVSGIAIGNVGQITLSTGPIYTTQSLNFISSASIPGCGMIYDTSVIDLYVMTPSVVVSNVLMDTICAKDSAIVEVYNSETNVSYQLNINGVDQPNVIVGNGGTLSFSTGRIMDTSAVIYISSQGITGCQLDNISHSLKVHVPKVHFTASQLMVAVNDDLSFYNTEEQLGYSYYWEFDNATPSNSNNSQPGNITFNSLGSQQVKLVATSSAGCQDSLIKTLKVIPLNQRDSCSFVVEAAAGQEAELKNLIDFKDEGFATFHSTKNETSFISTREMMDSVEVNFVVDQTYQHSHISRYSSDGLLKWRALIEVFDNDNEYNNSTGTTGAVDMITDDNNNLFVAYQLTSFIRDSVRITPSDGKVVRTKANFSGNSSIRGVIVSKFDSLGLHQWSNTCRSSYTSGVTIVEDSFGDLFVLGQHILTKFSAGGQLLWELDGLGYESSLSIYNDTLYIAFLSGGTYATYDLNGNLIYSSPTIAGASATVDIIHDDHGNFYICGLFGSINFANQSLIDVHTSGYAGGASHQDLFILKYDNDGNQDWIRTFSCDEEGYVKGFDYRNGRIHMLAVKGTDTLTTQGMPALNSTGKDIYLFSVDTANQFPELNVLYSYPTNFINRTVDVLQVTENNKVFAGFKYQYDYTVGNNVALDNTVSHTFTNYIILNVDTGCVANPANQTLSSAYFQADYICFGDTLFVDGVGSNNPTSFSWTSTVGSIHNPNAQSTYVVYDTAGVFELSLEVSNALGVGGTMTRYINVLPRPDFTIVGNLSPCFDDPSEGVKINGASYTVWYDNDTTLSNWSKFLTWANSPTNDSVFTFTAFDSYGCFLDSSVRFDVIERPSIEMVINPGSALCSGQPLDITVSGDNVDYFRWIQFNTFDPHLTGTAASGGNQLTLSIGNQGCMVDTILYSQHDSYPNMSFYNNNLNVCRGDSASKTVYGNASNYIWSDGHTGLIYSTIGDTSGVIQVSGYSANGQCVTSIPLNVVVFDPPQINYSFPSDTVCGSQVLSFSANGVNNTNSNWEVHNHYVGSTYTIANQDNINVTGQGDLEITIASVEVSSGNTCVVDTSIYITVVPNPSLSGQPVVCALDSGYLYIGSNVLGDFQWLYNGAYISNEDSVLIENTGVYTLTMDSIGCTTYANVSTSVFQQTDATILTPNGVVFCAGTSSTLLELQSNQSTGNNWYLNGVYQSNFQSTYATSSSAGTYVLEVNSTICPNDRDTVVVEVLSSSPAEIIIPQSSIPCIGDSLLLVSNETSSEWYSQGVLLTVNDSLYVNQSQWYLLTNPSNQCMSADSVQVSFVPQPIVNITASSGDTICWDGSTTLVSNYTTGNIWSQGSVQLSSSNQFTVTQAGDYQLLNMQGNCASEEDSISIYEFAYNMPVIALNAGLLSTGAFDTYQWYFNGISIASAINQNYQPSQNGNYTVVVSDTNGCSYESSIFEVNWSSVSEGSWKVNVSPNPFNEMISIQLGSMTGDNWVVEIIDLSGKLIKEEHIESINFLIDLSDIADGTYLLKIKDDNQNLYTTKIIKM